MAKLAIVLSVIGVFLAVQGIEAAVGAPVGKTSRASQTVRSSGTAGSRVMNQGSAVNFLDRITTDGSGVGEFVFNDGSKLAVGPSASLVVDQFVFQNNSSFRKLGLTASKGAFRWISGNSASSAYRIKTPRGTMGVRGTATDISVRGGVVHIVLLSGKARFCGGSTCRELNRACDYIVANGRSVSSAVPVASAFSSRQEAAKLFPYLANPNRLSSRFRVGASRCLAQIVENSRRRPSNSAAAVTGPLPPAPPGPEPDPPVPDPPVSPPRGNSCPGNCGVGFGNGGGNDTPNEGNGNGNGNGNGRP